MLQQYARHGCPACKRQKGHALHTGNLRHRLTTASSKATAQVTTNKAETWMKELDELLQRADETDAVNLVTTLKEQQFRGFGAARQIPKRSYTLEELRLNQIDATSLLSPKDRSLDSIRQLGQAAALAGLAGVAFSSGFDMSRVLGTAFLLVTAIVADQVATGGGGEALIVDSLGRLLNSQYRERVSLHEAGHFLVAYLVGVLPRAYTLSAWDAFTRYRTLNLQAGTQFCDGGFQAEVRSGRLSASSLDKYTCVALAGVVTEALRFGQAEGGVGDVAQLDGMLRALGFTQAKADSEIRWAVLNTATLLRRHAALHDKLAAAMSRGDSVASCVALIEEHLATVGEI